MLRDGLSEYEGAGSELILKSGPADADVTKSPSGWPSPAGVLSVFPADLLRRITHGINTLYMVRLQAFVVPNTKNT